MPLRRILDVEVESSNEINLFQIGPKPRAVKVSIRKSQ
jgi:hypothetical protein